MKNKGGVPVRRHILKVISFFAAITLWFYVLNSEHITIDARIPLVFITPTDLALNVKVPKTVKVKLKGSRAFVKNLNFDKEKVIVDIRDYPYKKKKSDSDIMNDNNVDEDYVMVIGKILKWRGTEEFKGKPYKLGYIMYVKRGEYWVNGKIMKLDPHFAIVLKKSYKRIKPKRIRDLLSPLKQKLRNGKPFGIYKDFPIIVKKTGHFS